MISKSEIKYITGLHQKKYRQAHGVFIAEGPKLITDLMDSGWLPKQYFSTEERPVKVSETVFQRISSSELKKISALKTPHTALATFAIPDHNLRTEAWFTVVLDAVRDPGNLGTIIRLCDWFGVDQLICSLDTVDCYNPKVVQATMGSLARVSIVYTELETYLETTTLPVFGAFMDGQNVYTSELPEKGILVMGNEANGISEAISEYITKRISIPQFGTKKETESLNVATATAILLSEFKRTTER